MAKLVSVTIPDLEHAVASFDAPVDPDTVSGGSAWQIAEVAGAMPVAAIDAVVRAGDQIVDLAIGAAMSAGANYTFSAPGAEAGGVPLPPIDYTLTAAAPAVDEPSTEWPHGELRALTRALGETLTELSGVPRTLLVRDLRWDDAAAFVESTLGWPTAAAFWAGGRRVTYTGKSDVSLTGLEIDDSTGDVIPTGEEVVCDVAAYLPA